MYYGQYLTQLRDQERDVVESINVIEDELSKDNIKESKNEEVELNFALLSSINTLKNLFTRRRVGDYLLYTWDRAMWVRSLNLSLSDYYPRHLNRLIDLYRYNSNMMDLAELSPLNVVFTHLSRQLKDNSHVGPYRLRKRDLPGFRDIVNKLLICADNRWSSIEQEMVVTDKWYSYEVLRL